MHVSINNHLGRTISYLKEIAVKGGPDPAEYEELSQCFSDLGDMVREGIISHDQFPVAWKELHGVFLSPDNMLGFGTLKPHGYAGDFELIDRIYRQRISRDTHLAQWDRYFHAQPATQAVRNRKEYFRELLAGISGNAIGKVSTVLNVGSGPGRDVRDAFDSGIHGIEVDCVDLDQKAIEYASTLVEPYTSIVRFFRCNALKFKPDRQYDLVWSAGLFDYLDDRGFKFLLGRLLKMVKVGGKVVIGNFSKNNPTRDFMEFGHWFLHHRSPKEIHLLAQECGVADNRISVESEAEGVNLFLHVKSHHGL